MAVGGGEVVQPGARVRRNAAVLGFIDLEIRNPHSHQLAVRIAHHAAERVICFKEAALGIHDEETVHGATQDGFVAAGELVDVLAGPVVSRWPVDRDESGAGVIARKGYDFDADGLVSAVGHAHQLQLAALAGQPELPQEFLV